MTVAELIAKLSAEPPDNVVEVWLPGSIVKLSSVFRHKERTLIEGNLMRGSALDDNRTDGDVKAFRAYIGLKEEAS